MRGQRKQNAIEMSENPNNIEHQEACKADASSPTSALQGHRGSDEGHRSLCCFLSLHRKSSCTGCAFCPRLNPARLVRLIELDQPLNPDALLKIIRCTRCWHFPSLPVSFTVFALWATSGFYFRPHD